jgi:hypothetical protein
MLPIFKRKRCYHSKNNLAQQKTSRLSPVSPCPRFPPGFPAENVPSVPGFPRFPSPVSVPGFRPRFPRLSPVSQNRTPGQE